MRILIVDDDEDIRDVLGVILESDGHQVATAADGLEALEVLLAGPRPDVMILDLMMPRMDGATLAKTMHRDPAWASIPVVVISGSQAALGVSDQLGAAACLIKPIELGELAEALDLAVPSPQPEAR